MYKNKGLGYLGTIIIIAIIIISSILAMRFIKKQYQNEEIQTIITDMLLIQGKSKIIVEENTALEKELKGIPISEKKEEDKIKRLIEEGIITISEDDKYYIFDKNILEEIGLKGIELNDEYYIVNYKDLDVIYTKGIEKNNQTLYKLSEVK